MSKKLIRELQDKVAQLEDRLAIKSRIAEEYGDRCKEHWLAQQNLEKVTKEIINNISEIRGEVSQLSVNTYLNAQREVTPMLANIENLINSRISLEIMRVKHVMDNVRRKHDEIFEKSLTENKTTV